MPWALFLIIIYGGSNNYTNNNASCFCIRGCSQANMHAGDITNDNVYRVDVTWNDSSVGFNYKGGSGRNFSMAALALGV